MISLYQTRPRTYLIKYCIEKKKRCCLLSYDCGATMASLIMTIIAMVPMVAMLSLSVSMYKWEQQHLEAESIAEEYIYTCREAAYEETHRNSINEIPREQIGKMPKVLSRCDDHLLYYKGRCELNSSKFFCSNSALEGYLILRGLENAERPAGFTRT